MPKTVTLPLAEPIAGHHGPITAVTLREPIAREYFQHGDPASWVRGPDGSDVLVENDAVIQAYLRACLVEPKDPLAIETCGLADAIALRDRSGHSAPVVGEHLPDDQHAEFE